MHRMQRASHDKAVRLSVKRVDCDKMKESSAQIFIPHERTFILVHWRITRNTAKGNRRRQDFLCRGRGYTHRRGVIFVVWRIKRRRWGGTWSGPSLPPKMSSFVWKWHIRVHFWFWMHSAYNSKMLSRQTEQICSLFSPWGCNCIPATVCPLIRPLTKAGEN